MEQVVMNRDRHCGDTPTKHIYESIRDFLAYTSSILPEIDIENYDHQTFLLHLLHTERSDSVVALLRRSIHGQAELPTHTLPTRTLLGMHTMFLSALSCVFLDDPQHTLIHPHAPTQDSEHAPLMYVPPANIQEYFCSHHRPCGATDPVSWLFYSLYPLVMLLQTLHAYGYPFDEYFTYWPLQVLKRAHPLSTSYAVTPPRMSLSPTHTDAACASTLRPRPQSDRVRALVLALLQPYVPAALLTTACAGWETEAAAARAWANDVGGVLSEHVYPGSTEPGEAGKVVSADERCVCRMCAVLAALQHTTTPSLDPHIPRRAVDVATLTAMPAPAYVEANYGDHADCGLLAVCQADGPGMSGTPAEAARRRLQAVEDAWATLMRCSSTSTITACTEAVSTQAHISAAPVSTGETTAAGVGRASGGAMDESPAPQMAAAVAWGAHVGAWLEAALDNVFHACASEVVTPETVEGGRVAGEAVRAAFPFVCGSEPTCPAACSGVATAAARPAIPMPLPVPPTLVDMCNKLIYLCVAALPAHPERIFYLVCALSRAVDSLLSSDNGLSELLRSKVWCTLQSCCLRVCSLLLVTPSHVSWTRTHANAMNGAWPSCDESQEVSAHEPSNPYLGGYGWVEEPVHVVNYCACGLRTSGACPVTCETRHSHVASVSVHAATTTTHLRGSTFAVLGELLARIDQRQGTLSGNGDVTGPEHDRTGAADLQTGHLPAAQVNRPVPTEATALKSDVNIEENGSSLALLRTLVPTLVSAVDMAGVQAIVSPTFTTSPSANSSTSTSLNANLQVDSSCTQRVAIAAYVEVLVDHYHAYMRMHACDAVTGNTRTSATEAGTWPRTAPCSWVAEETRPLRLSSPLLPPRTHPLPINLLASLRTALQTRRPHASSATGNSAWRLSALHALLHWPEQSLLAVWLLRRPALLRYAHSVHAMWAGAHAVNVEACARALEDDTLMCALLHSPHWCAPRGDDAPGAESPAVVRDALAAWWSVDVVVCESVAVTVADTLLAEAQAAANTSTAANPAAGGATPDTVRICVGALVAALVRCDADGMDMAAGALLRAVELNARSSASTNPVDIEDTLGISAECLRVLLVLSVWVEVRVRETLVASQRACEDNGREDSATMAGMLDWMRERGLLDDNGAATPPSSVRGGVVTALPSADLAAVRSGFQEGMDGEREEEYWAVSSATFGRAMLLAARVALLIREMARVTVMEKIGQDGGSNGQSPLPLVSRVCDLLRSHLDARVLRGGEECGSGGGKGGRVGHEEEYSGRHAQEDAGVPVRAGEWEPCVVALLDLLLPEHSIPVSPSLMPMQRTGGERGVPGMREQARRLWLTHAMAMVSGTVDAETWLWGADDEAEDDSDTDEDEVEGEDEDEESECWEDGWAEEGDVAEWDEEEDVGTEEEVGGSAG